MKKHGGSRAGSGRKKYPKNFVRKEYLLPASEIPKVTAFVNKIKEKYLMPRAKTTKALKEANNKQNLDPIENLDEFLNKL